MKTSIKIKSGNPEEEVNQTVTEWVEKVLLSAPFEMQLKPGRCFLAIPNIVQRMILRHFRAQHSSIQIGSFASSSEDHTTVFTTLFGYKVVPGYEMAIVLYAANDPERMIYRVNFSLSSDEEQKQGEQTFEIPNV